MNHSSLASSKYFLRECVQKTEARLRRQNKPATASKIISDQMLGFWLSFFVPHHYALIGGQPIFIFPHKPAGEGRASLHRKLENIQRFRNRMNHCEPLCFRGNTIDCTTAQIIHAQLYDLIRWINPDLIPYFESIDKVPVAIDLLTKI